MSYFVTSYGHDVGEWGGKKYGSMPSEIKPIESHMIRERSLPRNAFSQDEPCHCESHEHDTPCRCFGQSTRDYSAHQEDAKNQEKKVYKMTTEYRSRYMALEGESALPGNSYADRTRAIKASPYNNDVVQERKYHEPTMTTTYRNSYCK